MNDPTQADSEDERFVTELSDRIEEERLEQELDRWLDDVLGDESC